MTLEMEKGIALKYHQYVSYINKHIPLCNIEQSTASKKGTEYFSFKQYRILIVFNVYTKMFHWTQAYSIPDNAVIWVTKSSDAIIVISNLNNVINHKISLHNRRKDVHE